MTTRTKKPAKTPRAKKPLKPQKPRARKTAPVVAEVEPETTPLDASPLGADVDDARPERAFAARTPPPAPERPRPDRRRAVFIDVENTSKASRIVDVLAHLALDREAWAVDLVASGNWRVIGSETARILAQSGAQLVHSAPKTGVRDWSDLRIAVGAGAWIAAARPGDRLEIVSDDKAFDAVGDVAASVGIEFVRVSPRGLGRAESAAPSPAEGQGTQGRSRRRRGGRGRSQSGPRAPVQSAEPVAVVAQAPSEPSGAPEESYETPESSGSLPASAPVEDLLAVARDLLAGAPNGVTLDAVAAKLKALGFTRPPGSPRLVTRLRAVKELAVSPRGWVTLRGEGSPPPEPTDPGANATPNAGTGHRRRRRGGRGRSHAPAAS